MNVYRSKDRVVAWRVPEDYSMLDVPEWLVESTRVKFINGRPACERNPWIADSDEPEWQIAYPSDWIVRAENVLCPIDEYTFVFTDERFTESYEADQ